MIMLEFCNECAVLAMRSKLVLANISLVLLASSCLVTCTAHLPEGPSNQAFRSEQTAARTALDKNDPRALYERELSRISSELCARFPHKCLPDELFDTKDCLGIGATSKGVACRRPDRRLREPLDSDDSRGEQFEALGEASAAFGQTNGMDEALVLEEQAGRMRSGNLTSASLSNQLVGELNKWLEARLNGHSDEAKSETLRPSTNLKRFVPTSGRHDEAGDHETFDRGLRESYQFSSIKSDRAFERARHRWQQKEHKQHKQQQLFQLQMKRKMDQHIVSALPSAFASNAWALGGAPLVTRPTSANQGPGARSRARARSTRLYRSGELPEGGETGSVGRVSMGQLGAVVVPKRTASDDDDDDDDEEEASATVATRYAIGGQLTSGRHQIAERELRRANRAGVGGGGDDDSADDDETSAMQCNMRQFTFTATKTDESGNTCSGSVAANICYGGCDTGEISDWLFPGKKSIHKVCRHGGRIRRRAILTNCTSDSIAADDQLRFYHYVDARDCVCKKCASIDTACLGTMSQPHLQTVGGGGGGGSGGAGGAFATDELEPILEGGD